MGLITRLPVEILNQICAECRFQDIFSLSLTCRQLFDGLSFIRPADSHCYSWLKSCTAKPVLDSDHPSCYGALQQVHKIIAAIGKNQVRPEILLEDDHASPYPLNINKFPDHPIKPSIVFRWSFYTDPLLPHGWRPAWPSKDNRHLVFLGDLDYVGNEHLWTPEFTVYVERTQCAKSLLESPNRMVLDFETLSLGLLDPINDLPLDGILQGPQLHYCLYRSKSEVGEHLLLEYFAAGRLYRTWAIPDLKGSFVDRGIYDMYGDRFAMVTGKELLHVEHLAVWSPSSKEPIWRVPIRSSPARPLRVMINNSVAMLHYRSCPDIFSHLLEFFDLDTGKSISSIILSDVDDMNAYLGDWYTLIVYTAQDKLSLLLVPIQSRSINLNPSSRRKADNFFYLLDCYHVRCDTVDVTVSQDGNYIALHTGEDILIIDLFRSDLLLGHLRQSTADQSRDNILDWTVIDCDANIYAFTQPFLGHCLCLCKESNTGRVGFDEASKSFTPGTLFTGRR